ncbi:MAG TPA: ATP-binding protein [Bryobacteraceae bacterium]|nr:ATP-binding protein [Bryobacteraceae bacterium]
MSPSDLERLRLENEQLAQALETARQATAAKSRFLATMSHEIRTPLNGIIGMIDLLLGTPLSEEQREYAVTLSDSADGLLALLNDILDFSKIEAGKLAPERAPFSLEKVVQCVWKLMSGKGSASCLQYQLEISPRLPQLVLGDECRLRQVLNNLLANAIKFTRQGTIRLEVDMIGERASDYLVRFAVRDTGIGIPPEALVRIFECFAQADQSSTRLYGGSGLGLSIARQLVELMGGQMGVQSRVGEGSTFWFTLPFAKSFSHCAGEDTTATLTATI